MDKEISKLYYDLYRAQMHADWKSADLIQKKLRELEAKEEGKMGRGIDVT